MTFSAASVEVELCRGMIVRFPVALYVGVTSDLIKRVWEHREGVVEGFTKEFGVKQLVWYETHTNAMSAITREKQIKKWHRAWKINLIQKENPYWQDLYETLSA